jgi:hypothetical protein
VRVRYSLPSASFSVDEKKAVNPAFFSGGPLAPYDFCVSRMSAVDDLMRAQNLVVRATTLAA